MDKDMYLRFGFKVVLYQFFLTFQRNLFDFEPISKSAGSIMSKFSFESANASFVIFKKIVKLSQIRKLD